MARARRQEGPPPPCPDCGEPLALGGRFCKACGYDADLAESEDAYLDGIEIPDGYADDPEDDARYEEALEASGLRSSFRAIAIAIIAILTALAILLAALR